MVQSRRSGKWVYYRLSHEHLLVEKLAVVIAQLSDSEKQLSLDLCLLPDMECS